MPEKSDQNSLAIIGNGDVIAGFKALGFNIYPATSSEECKRALAQAMREGAAICLIQESIYPYVKLEIAQYETQPLPIFIPFETDSQMKLFDQMIKSIRLKAIGVH